LLQGGEGLMFERLNREEGGLFERWLPGDAPPRGLIASRRRPRRGVVAGRGGSAGAVARTLPGRRAGYRASGGGVEWYRPHNPPGPGSTATGGCGPARVRGVGTQAAGSVVPSAHAAVAAAFTTALARRIGPAVWG